MHALESNGSTQPDGRSARGAAQGLLYALAPLALRLCRDRVAAVRAAAAAEAGAMLARADALDARARARPRAPASQPPSRSEGSGPCAVPRPATPPPASAGARAGAAGSGSDAAVQGPPAGGGDAAALGCGAGGAEQGWCGADVGALLAERLAELAGERCHQLRLAFLGACASAAGARLRGPGRIGTVCSVRDWRLQQAAAQTERVLLHESPLAAGVPLGKALMLGALAAGAKSASVPARGL